MVNATRDLAVVILISGLSRDGSCRCHKHSPILEWRPNLNLITFMSNFIFTHENSPLEVVDVSFFFVPLQRRLEKVLQVLNKFQHGALGSVCCSVGASSESPSGHWCWVISRNESCEYFS